MKGVKTPMTEEEFYKFLGEKIREFRKEANMTLEDVCRIVGLYNTDLSKFEKRGERIRSAYMITNIIVATGHTWKDLFRESDPEKKTLKSRSRFPPYQTAMAGAN
jgi:transcriptional regulator with XRE-family HTH domain